METENTQNANPEVWQVEVNGQIYETYFEELTEWIAEGALLPADKVRRGNLRWLEANKVPLLYGFFNAKELGIAPPKVSTTINQPIQETTPPVANNFQTTQASTGNNLNTSESSTNAAYPTQTESYQNVTNLPPQNPSSSSCVIHEGEEPKFTCETCLNLFCRNCPNTYGTVKICPMCGAMCKPLTEVKQEQKRQQQFQYANSEGFGFSDFGKALVFPFKYKVSLIAGAIMYMLFTLGQSATALGGIYMIVSAIFCAMLANMLTFGILANTVDNFSQGKTETNFMPDFEDFNLWDDVVHPFFLSLGVYISSFGPLVALIIVMVFFVINDTKSEVDAIKQKTVVATAPELRNEYESSTQTPQIKAITDNIKDKSTQYNRQIESVENNGANQTQPVAADEEKAFKDLNDQINQTRKRQLESTVGKTSETEGAEYNQFAQKILGAAVPFLLLAGAGLVWGLFYFPAACAVAGYTRSFGATINPLVGLDTIKHLGIDYVKILGMTIILSLISFFINGVLKIVLLPFDLPRFGNLPAYVIGSFFTFYFSIVFSVILGYALFKNSDKLKLYR